jgi:hypothetical protein
MARHTIIQDYMGKKMGDFLSGVIGDLNPISVARGQQASKNSITGNVKAIKDLMLTKKGQGMSLSDFFSGKRIHTDMQSGNKARFGRIISDGSDDARASVRAVAAGTIAAYGAAPVLLGEDNIVSRTIEGGAAVGMHAGIIAASIRSGGSGPMFGVGYAGFAAVNAIRQGNNFGPF